jgi:pyrroline-5-carboxylate reductase
MLSQTIGFIGMGQMARALAGGWIRAGLVSAEQLRAFDPSESALTSAAADFPGITICESNSEVAQGADIVVLAVKPQLVSEALKSLAFDFVTSREKSAPLFISIAAGCALKRLKDELKEARWIRVMPNTPCLVGESASAFAADEDVPTKDIAIVQKLLEGVGRAWQVPEKLLDAVTGLSGSGPAYVFMMIEALADGGVKMGLPRDIAMALAAQTMRGAATMVLETGEHPGVLKDRVASPAGTTIAGINEMEKLGVRGALISAVTAATNRATELSKG